MLNLRHSLRYAAVVVLLAAQSAYAQVAIDNEAGSSFKGTKRVAIAQFGIEYYTQLMAVGRSGGNTVRQSSKLAGVSEAAMQAMAERLYADTVARLKEAGFEVVDQNQLTADTGYQELVAKYAKPSGREVHDGQGLGEGEHLSRVFSPAGMMAFFATSGSSNGLLRGNMSDRLDAQNYGIAMREAEVAKRLNATMLKFNFLANYGVVKGSKNGFLATFANSAAKVALETAAVVQSHDTQVQWVDAGGARMFGNVRRAGATGAFYLDQSLIGENPFTLADSTTAGSKADDNKSNALFGLFGGHNAKKSQALQVDSDDERYSAAFSKVLDQANLALIAALKNAR
ncbi:MAG: hypothetical protein Q7T25_02535 [Sideroxyarcus sp.]|nr:hypothetical protein [Sideroxyarcus sp.]